MSSQESPLPTSLAGTPRIAVVFGVSLFNYVSHALIRYSTPLYFNALEYPEETYESFVFYWLAAFIAGSSFSGLLASRFGERHVWSGSLLLFASLGLLLIHIPGHWMIPFSGLLYGVSAAGQWVGAMALVQTVNPSKRGRANSLLMIALGAGSFIGAPVGKLLLEWSSDGNPAPGDFAPLFWAHVLICVVGAILIATVSRHPGPVRRQVSEDSWRTNLSLLKMPRYLAMVIPLSLMGGPVFQTVNIYLRYRASDPEIGLMAGAVDQGWYALLTAGYGFQFLGGLAILLIAGRKASAGLAAGVLLTYSICSLGIGLSPMPTSFSSSPPCSSSSASSCAGLRPAISPSTCRSTCGVQHRLFDDPEWAEFDPLRLHYATGSDTGNFRFFILFSVLHRRKHRSPGGATAVDLRQNTARDFTVASTDLGCGHGDRSRETIIWEQSD